MMLDFKSWFMLGCLPWVIIGIVPFCVTVWFLFQHVTIGWTP